MARTPPLPDKAARAGSTSEAGKAKDVVAEDGVPAATASSAITGEEVDSDNLDAVTSGTLTEVGNIVMNGVMGSISNVISKHFDYAIPNYVEGTLESFLASKGADGDTQILLARARFAIEDHQIEGDIMLIFEGGSLEALLEAIGMVEAN